MAWSRFPFFRKTSMRRLSKSVSTRVNNWAPYTYNRDMFMRLLWHTYNRYVRGARSNDRIKWRRC